MARNVTRNLRSHLSNCLKIADEQGLRLVAIHICQALECLEKSDLGADKGENKPQSPEGVFGSSLMDAGLETPAAFTQDK